LQSLLNLMRQPELELLSPEEGCDFLFEGKNKAIDHHRIQTGLTMPEDFKEVQNSYQLAMVQAGNAIRALYAPGIAEWLGIETSPEKRIG
jgi:hypothetical protein